MVWGALVGRILGEVMQLIHETHRSWPIFAACPPEGSCVTPGMYSLLGAVGALGVFSIDIGDHQTHRFFDCYHVRINGDLELYCTLHGDIGVC
jgi:hypothetical protein